jgi:hypothetical protein
MDEAAREARFHRSRGVPIGTRDCRRFAPKLPTLTFTALVRRGSLVPHSRSGSKRRSSNELAKARDGNCLEQIPKATIVGGLLFLLPLALVLIVLRRAMQAAGKVAEPISALLPDALAGAVAATILAILLLVLVSFLAGLVARTHAGRRTMRLFENSLLGGIPQYQLVKVWLRALPRSRTPRASSRH